MFHVNHLILCQWYYLFHVNHVLVDAVRAVSRESFHGQLKDLERSPETVPCFT